MAHKRMFSKDVTASDAFLDMPASTQALYFHLGMEADDDGFIGNPKKVMRVIGVSDDDLKILFTKKFVIAFPSGVLVVKHHRMNNNWDKYNCKRTTYLEEFSQLRIKENRAYTLDNEQGIPVQTDSSLLAVSRIEENRIDKNTNTRVAIAPHYELVKEEEKPKREPTAKYPHSREVFALWGVYPKHWDSMKEVRQREAAENLYDELGLEEIKACVDFLASHRKEKFCPRIHSPHDLREKYSKLDDYVNNPK